MLKLEHDAAPAAILEVMKRGVRTICVHLLIGRAGTSSDPFPPTCSQTRVARQLLPGSKFQPISRLKSVAVRGKSKLLAG